MTPTTPTRVRGRDFGQTITTTVHFLGNLDSLKKSPEQDVCQNDRGDPPKRKTAFFQIFTDAISRNFAVTVQIGAI